ncbi:MAG: signal peptide peptidase SppA [Chitinophagales bacterium]|nr:signal peptide peptidase SppA [Chitinophagales bacterium]
MNFFKQVFATIVGLFIFQIIAGIIAVIFIGAMIASFGSKADSSVQVDIKDNSIIQLDLSEGLSEKDGFSSFNYTSPQEMPKESAGLQSVLEAIEFAKTDDRIKGIYIKMSMLPEGYATIDALRKKLLDFKESGKFIVAYGEMLDQKTYYLSTVANELYVNPEGYMEIRGIGTRLTFFKKLLEEKLNAKVQVFKVGDFKSAVEPFINEKMSDANREQLEYLLGGIKHDFVNNIAIARNLTPEKVDAIINNLQGLDPDSSLHYGLIDGTKYYDEILTNLKEKTGIKDEDDLNVVDMSAYAISTAKTNKSSNQIAVVYAEGDIVDGKGEDGSSIGGESFSKIIRELRQDEDIDAIVLRVNSPGGSALASEVMWREITLAKQDKPVVVSMGDVAASGGYYISCNANRIFVEENTITGSIGVFGLVPNLQDFLNNKLGVTFDEVTLNDHAVSNGVTKEFTPFEAEVMQKNVDNIYTTFTSRVAEGRGLPIEKVLAVASGRVWTGEQAIERGLADELGGLDEAVKYASSLAELSDYRIKEYPKQKSPIEAILEDLGVEAKNNKIKESMGVLYPYYQELQRINNMQGKVQMAMPYTLEIN